MNKDLHTLSPLYYDNESIWTQMSSII